jgi:hypothetical protein
MSLYMPGKATEVAALVSVFVFFFPPSRIIYGDLSKITTVYFSATVLILIRSAYRIALYARGFDGDVATDQRLFGTFETAAMFVALLKMTASPPGWFMGREGWKLDGWDEKRWEVVETYDSQSSTLGRGGEESDTFRNGQLPPPCEA